MKLPPSVQVPGPTFFPMIIIGLLLLMAVLSTVQILRNRAQAAARRSRPATVRPRGFDDVDAHPDEFDADSVDLDGDQVDEIPPDVPPGREPWPAKAFSDWRALGIVLGSLVACIALLVPAGWIIAAAVLFWGVSYALGSRRPVFDLSVALVMSSLIQLIFGALLGPEPAGRIPGGGALTMDQLSNLMQGFGSVLTPMNLLWVFVGCMLGTAVGVLPGLGSAMAVALLLPVTFSLDPVGAFIMFAGIYYGGLFGDSTTAILMNTPGNSTAIASTFEGHRMAKRGRGPQALATAAIGAFTGGLLATILVVFFAPVLADLATVFGPTEYFALAVVAFIATAAVVADSAVKGVAALSIGLALALVGVDWHQWRLALHLRGCRRCSTGSTSSSSPSACWPSARCCTSHPGSTRIRSATTMGMNKRPFLSRGEFREALPAWLRGSAFGVPFGAIPAGGAEIPTFLAFGLERRLDRRRKDPQFGKGAIRGLAAPESAANATAGSAMGSLLALGLPTSATAAIMLAAFQQYGMQPGPLLFTRNSDLVWALLASLFVGMFVLLIINLPFAPLWAKLLLIPKPYLYAGITVFAVLGVYAGSSSLIDLVLLVLIGLLGFVLRRYGLPLAPVLIAVILGPLAETSLRRALAVSEGDVGTLFDSGLALTLYGLLALGIIWVGVNKVRGRVKVDI